MTSLDPRRPDRDVVEQARLLLEETTRSLAGDSTRLSWAVIDGDETHLGGDDGVYCIASMTKSFTAATVLGAARGLIPTVRALRLDDPLGTWVPELRHEIASATVTDALTMSTGLPPDDPWADRQQAMSREEFRRLLGHRLLTNFRPGTSYCYSNLGYAILGLVVERATDRPFTEVVTAEVLRPLGMEHSWLDVTLVPEEALVPGLRTTTPQGVEPLPGPGAFSPIGGLLSTCSDLTVWTRAMIDAWTDPSPDGWPRVRRDMQQLRRLFTHDHAEDAGVDVVEGYGWGLRVSQTPAGMVVNHGGGYPGYGSSMRWHPASRTGVIALANRTYHPASSLTDHVLDLLVPGARSLGRESTDRRRKGSEPVIAGAMDPQVRRRLDQVEELIRSGSVEPEDSTWAPNMDLDVPRAERRRRFREAVTATGETHNAPVAFTELSATRATWTVRGRHGQRTVTASVNPLGQVQSIDIETDQMSSKEVPRVSRANM